jgi:aldehyde dehydrogenase (NAD+)
MQSILQSLGLTDINSGAGTGTGWWAPTHDRCISSINPSHGETIAKVASCTHADYVRVMDETTAAFEIWRQVPAPKRGDIVRQIGDALRLKKDALGSLVSLEMGKIKSEGDGEVQEMIDMADFAVGQSRMLYGNTMHSERPQHRMYEQWHPIGVVGIISAFNFPVAVWAWNAFLAAICGNTTVWKPAKKTPLTAIAVQHICNQVLKQNNLPAIFSLFITEDKTITEQFVDDTRVALLSFTGSTEVGRHVNERLAKRLGRGLLELGGNNALIVDETASLALAIPAIVFGAVGTAGQRCTTTRRLFLHESIYDTVITQLISAYAQIKIGDPLEQGVLMGPLVDAQAVTQYELILKEIQQQGGKILCGGKVLPGNGYFVSPTIVEAKPEWSMVQRETFVPILYVMSYTTTEEAIRFNNHVPQGLSSSIFTNNLQTAEQFLSSVGSDCGIANVNIGTSGAEIGGAFGGEKETGGGREAGSDAWKVYMRRQTNTLNWSHQLPLAQGIRFELG